MLGVTNAQGVTGPYLAQELYGQSQDFLLSLDEIREQLSELQGNYERMRNNPRLGAIVNYAGFDWIVCHLDYESGVYYLAMKDIYECVKFSETGGSAFRGSNLEARLKRFDDVLRIFAVGLTRLTVATDLVENTYHFIEYGNGTSYSSSTYAFVASYEQITNEFDLFKGNQFGRRIARDAGNSNRISFGTSYGIADGLELDTDVKPWWTCTENPKGGVYYVNYDGNCADIIGTDTKSEYGFRPFICMRMRR